MYNKQLETLNEYNNLKDKTPETTKEARKAMKKYDKLLIRKEYLVAVMAEITDTVSIYKKN